MTDILPTFTCFDDAMEFVTHALREHKAGFDDMRIVHGIGRAEDGQRYAHAWVEVHGKCWDAGIVDGHKVFYSMDAVEYYKARRIREATSYSMLDVYYEATRGGHSGPWKADYRQLCDETRVVMGEFQAVYQPPG